MDNQIANLRELLDIGAIITNLEISKLTANGENYGSQMLALKIQTETKNYETVAKLPPRGEFMRRMFNIPVTFKNEYDFYHTIIPELEAFLNERGIVGYLDIFPKFLGGRLTLEKEKNEVDDDAVLLLENLKTQGYEMLQRTVGFDYETAQLVIKTMAKYHAVSLGLKLLKPEAFQEKIRPLFQEYRVFVFDDAVREGVIEKFKNMVEDIDSCKQYSARIVETFRSSILISKTSPELIREPFATIVHTDTWINNFMIKFQGDKPVHCKIVDFQLGEYGSPARDVFFFIFSSVQIPVVREHYDDLVQLYHETLVESLTSFGCDTASFSFEKFQEEIAIVAREYEIFHSIMMLQPIFAPDESLKELEDYNEEDMSKEEPVPPKQKEKLEFLVQEFAKRNWI